MLTRGELLATCRIIAIFASRLLSADQIAHVSVLASIAVAALGAWLPILKALTIVLKTARFLATVR